MNPMTSEEIERVVGGAKKYLLGNVVDISLAQTCRALIVLHERERERLTETAFFPTFFASDEFQRTPAADGPEARADRASEVEAMAQKFYEAVAHGSWADTMMAEVLNCGGPVKYSFALAEAFFAERDRRREQGK